MADTQTRLHSRYGPMPVTSSVDTGIGGESPGVLVLNVVRNKPIHRIYGKLRAKELGQ